MSQSVEKYRDVVGTRLIVRLKADDPYFQIPKKMLVIRTHPEELRVVKSIANAHIFTKFSQQ